jgi:eukaryotic-like serine/threonine-protein kinase
MGDSKAMATSANPPRRTGMTSERWERIKSALSVALETDPAQLSSCLDNLCGDDPALRLEVENLLALKDDPDLALLESAAVALATDETALTKSAWIGRRVGPYEIVEEIGAGGMGEVYRATRADDQFRKEVAIKLVRVGYDSDFIVARFRTERQVLAGLEHPNIARLLDGGTTKEGVPYFAMELVEGQPLYEFCDSRKLNTSDRLRLFLQICSAVQYAHQRLIVHRDLKPGNILVTADGTPKLLDFGIAKILNDAPASGSNDSSATVFRFLTPEYASPEQVRGEAVTTASDVYSLGLLLYEILTGHRPYRAAGDAPHQIARAICETAPEKASAIVLRTGQGLKNSTTPELTPAIVSAARDGTPEKLSRRLQGDLDNILLTALRKETERRYASVEQMANDIRRHLEHLPVSAASDTVGYRLSKFVARNKTGVTAAALIVLVVLAAAAASLYEAHRARQNELRAERRFNDVRALANSLLFDIHDSIRDLPGATATRKLIVQRAQEYLDNLSRESRSDPALLRELAASYIRLASVQGDDRDANLGDTPAALANFRRAVELLENAIALDPANRDARIELARTCLSLGRGLSGTGNNKGNEEQVQRAFGILEPLATSNPGDQKTLAVLGEAYAQAGFAYSVDNDPAQALIYHEKSLAVYQRLASDDPGNEKYQTELAFCQKRVAAVLGTQKQYAEALAHERAALNIDEAQLASHPQSVLARYNITLTYSDTGYFLAEQGNFDTALTWYRKALDIREALAQADPRDTKAKEGLSNTQDYIGMVLRRKGDLTAAIDPYRKSLALRRELLERNPARNVLRTKVAWSEWHLGDVYAALAFQTKSSRRDQVAYCRESEKSYRSALPVLQRVESGAKSAAVGLGDLSKFALDIARCDKILGSAAQP